MNKMSLAGWQGRPRPDGRRLEGKFVFLEKLSASKHGTDLGEVLAGEPIAGLYDYLGDPPPRTAGEVEAWAAKAETSADPYFLAIIDRQSGRAIGRLALMRIDAANGAIEVGHVLYSPLLQRSPHASEAQYLLMRHVFEDLGYRRYEWKCNALNFPSRAAARRMGFVYEGLFHQHMVVKGANRDTAWFSILDREWPRRKQAFEAWLAADNHDAHWRQKHSLGALVTLHTAPAGDGDVMARLRRMDRSEATALTAFQMICYADNERLTGRRPVPLIWNYDEILTQCEVWALGDGDDIEAAVIFRDNREELYLESIAIGPEFQRRGLGDQLLRFAARRAGTHRSGTLRFITNSAIKRNVDWYLSRGFLIEEMEDIGDRIVAHFVKQVNGASNER